MFIGAIYLLLQSITDQASSLPYLQVVSSLKTFAQQQLGYDGTKDPIIECIPVKGLQSVQHSAMVVVMQTLW